MPLNSNLLPVGTKVLTLIRAALESSSATFTGEVIEPGTPGTIIGYWVERETGSMVPSAPAVMFPYIVGFEGYEGVCIRAFSELEVL
jgi:hypothetical protein